MILIIARHAMPTTCTPRDKQHDSPHNTRIKVKLPKYLRFKFKHRQVNDPSQSNQGTDHLVSQSPPWWVHWQQKAQRFKFECKTPWSIARRPKKPRKAQEGHLEEEKAVRPTKGTESSKSSKNVTKELKKAQSQNRTSKKGSNSKTPLSQLPLTLSPP
jgi:hypothetical protein